MKISQLQALQLLSVWLVGLLLWSCERAAASSMHMHLEFSAQHAAAGDKHDLAHLATGKVALVNPFPWCQELYLALAYTLSHITPHVDSFVDIGPEGFFSQHVDKVLDGLGVASNVSSVEEIDAPGLVASGDSILSAYDLIVYPDWYPNGMGYSHTPRDTLAQRLLQSGYNGSIVITVNEAYQLLPWPIESGFRSGDPEVQHWRQELLDVLADDRVHLLTISPHVADYLQHDRLPRFNISKPGPVGWYFPVFPLAPHSCGNASACAAVPAAPSSRRGFVLQGQLEQYRRDYEGLFRRLLDTPELIDHPRFQLSLVGRNTGGILVPEQLHGKVLILENLPSTEFYDVLRGSLAMITSFARASYVTDVASSSVATAFIAGVPLCGGPDMLHAYGFLSATAMYFQADGGDDVACMLRVLRMSDAEIEDVFGNTQILRDAQIHRNIKVFRRLLKHGMGARLAASRRVHAAMKP